MPADTRLLFRAAVASSSTQPTAEGGIKDRFVSYHPKTRALRCTACDYLTVKHESLWASHAASKSHRSNVAKIRLEEEEKERESQASHIQQQEEEIGASTSISTPTATGTGTMNKRKERSMEEETSKRVKTGEAEDLSENVDSEWERFQREVLNAPTIVEQPALSNYANATIEVAPELRPGINGEIEQENEEVEEENYTGQPVAETEAERRARLEREDREEILARLEEEQRVQDEADERVSALKNRLEKLKQARAAKKQ